MRALTHDYEHDGNVEVEIVSGPNAGGLCRVRLEHGSEVVRHVKRLFPVDEEAKERLGKDSKGIM